MNANSYMQTLLWCCTSCGFTLEGGQPHMECPICEAYKTSFIDIPQHVEAEVREKYKDVPNSAEARRLRKKLLAEGGFLRTFRVRGRMTEAVNESAHSRDYLADPTRHSS